MAFVSPAEGRVTSHWGPRERHPVTGVRGFHRGIDIAPPRPGQRGCPVYAAYAGTVVYVSEGVYNKTARRWEHNRSVTGGWNSGSLVVVAGPGGGNEAYGHMSGIRVKTGQRVKAGDLLGFMDAIGNVTGIHLHLEMWDGRTQGGGLKGGNTRDPRIDFKRHGITPGSAPIFPKTPTTLPQKEDEMLTDRQAQMLTEIHRSVHNTEGVARRIDPGKGKTLLGEITGSRPLSDEDVDGIQDALRKVKDAVGRTDPGKGRKLVPEIESLLATIETQED